MYNNKYNYVYVPQKLCYIIISSIVHKRIAHDVSEVIMHRPYMLAIIVTEHSSSYATCDQYEPPRGRQT